MTTLTKKNPLAVVLGLVSLALVSNSDAALTITPNTSSLPYATALAGGSYSVSFVVTSSGSSTLKGSGLTLPAITFEVENPDLAYSWSAQGINPGSSYTANTTGSLFTSLAFSSAPGKNWQGGTQFANNDSYVYTVSFTIADKATLKALYGVTDNFQATFTLSSLLNQTGNAGRVSTTPATFNISSVPEPSQLVAGGILLSAGGFFVFRTRSKKSRDLEDKE